MTASSPRPDPTRDEGAERAPSLADLLDPALYAEFRSGAEEHFAAAEAALLALEARPGERAPLDAAFRAFHSVKGDAGCLGLAAVARITHAAESALARVREGSAALEGPVADALLGALDVSRRLAAASGDAPDASVPEEVERVAARLESASLGEDGRASPESAPSAAATLAPATEETRPTARVDVARLDALLDIVGELSICEAQAAEGLGARLGPADRAGPLGRELHRLRGLVHDLQRTALSLRMVPVRPLFRKLHRIARDICRRGRKRVEVVARGEETELDRSVLAELADPLVHLVRNAIDHGVEEPRERLAAGKPAGARVEVGAIARGGFVHVTVSDDGRGIDVARVVRRARERGLVRPDEPVDEARALRLIFEPGFTTADAVTEISGRGVGLDVVRSRLERLHGHVAVDTVPGRGTTFTLKLPLTLSVLDGMVVAAGAERYVVPTAAIVEVVRPAPGERGTVCGRAETLRFRGATLPLVRLARALGLERPGAPEGFGLAVVVDALGRRAALAVDDVLGQRQVVVKSLGERLRGLPGVLGGTVLGDGRVGLIIDVDGIVPGGAVERRERPAA
jgi:two-component system chemotaxis sensor kinase CheA